MQLSAIEVKITKLKNMFLICQYFKGFDRRTLKKGGAKNKAISISSILCWEIFGTVLNTQPGARLKKNGKQ